MARNTAEYSNRHREEHQEQYEPRTPQEAFKDFTNKLDERYPDVAKDLREEHHPLSKDHDHAWLDPKRQDEVVAHIHMAFQDSTSGMDHDDKYAAAQMVEEKLTAPLTHPAKSIAETYAKETPGDASENVKYYSGFLKAASEQAASLNGVAADTIANHLADDNVRHTMIADDLLTMEKQLKDSHLSYITYSLYNARPEGMDHDQREEHAKALAEALAYPMVDRINHGREDFANPMNDYRDHLRNGNEQNNYALSSSTKAGYADVADLAHRMLEINEHRAYEAEERLDKTKEKLVHDLTQTEYGFNEIQQALTDINQLNQRLDYRNPQEEASDLRTTFESIVRESGQDYREDIAHNFTQALAWPLQKDLQGLNYSPNPAVRDIVEPLLERTENQVKDLAERMTSGEYDADSIRFTLQGFNQTRSEAEHALSAYRTSQDNARAEYAQDTTEFTDWETDTNHEKALVSFKETLETIDPQLYDYFQKAADGPEKYRDPDGNVRADLTGPATYERKHPGQWENDSVRFPPWLDSRTSMESLAEINLAFREATKDLNQDEKAWVAYQITTALAAPTTYPVQEFREHYTSLPGQDDEQIVTDIMAAANKVSDRIENFAETLQTAFQMGNLQLEAYRELLYSMDWNSADANYHMANSIRDSVDHRTANMTQEQRADYHQQLAHTLTAPVQERASQIAEDYNTQAIPLYQEMETLENKSRDAEEDVRYRTLQAIHENIMEHRADAIADIRRQAEYSANELVERLDADGANAAHLQHTLESLQNLHAALDHQQSYNAQAQRIAEGVIHAYMQDFAPGRSAIASYVADALTKPTSAKLLDYSKNNGPESHAYDKVPHRDEYFRMTDAAVAGALREMDHLKERIVGNLEGNANADALASYMKAINELPAALEHMERTGDPPEFLDQQGLAEFNQASQERTDAMVRDMEMYVQEQKPHEYRYAGNTWAQRLQYPEMMEAMTAYNNNLPAHDQRRIANEILRRADNE